MVGGLVCEHAKGIDQRLRHFARITEPLRTGRQLSTEGCLRLMREAQDE
jgi:hypothetical protein